jgi:hypothetical protein
MSRTGSVFLAGATLGALLTFTLPESANAAALVTYNPIGNQVSSAPLSPSFVDPSVTASTLTQNIPQGWLNTNVWPVPVLNGNGTNLNNFLSFTVTPTGVPIQFDSLNYTYRSYRTGLNGASIRSSLDGFANDVASLSLIPGSTTQTFSLNLSSLAPVNAPITFRLFFSPVTGSQTDWADLVSNASGGQGLVLNGTPIPTPALLPGLISMGVAVLRKRKQEKVEAEV